MNSIFRRLVDLLWLCGAVAALAAWQPCRAADDGCLALTRLSREDLATFDLEGGSGPGTSLDAGRGYRLRRIDVVRQDVFEQERNWVERLANRYHRRTREHVVLSVLPFASGDRVNARRLAEAERILRQKIYLFDARVIPRQVCGDALDIYVVTRDVWTLMPRLSLARTGGENDVGAGLGETNLLGTGRYASVGYQKDKDRHGVAFDFGDPNLAGSRWALDLAAMYNDDGDRTTVSVQRPFYALDTRRALAFASDDFRRKEGLYYLGDKAWEYRADSRSVRAYAGWSSGLRGRFVNRLLLGYAHEDYRFELPEDFVAAFPDVELPEREYSYPFVAFQRVEDDFETRVNLDRVQRTEDLALGRRLYAELGYSGGAAAIGRNLIGRLTYADAAWLAPRHLVAFDTWLDGYYDLDDHTSENLRLTVGLSYRYQQADAWSLLLEGAASAVRHPTLDQQLLLGGETGLRGYPNRYQTGDRRFLLTMEERYYSNLYPLRMFRLGAAVFLDAGRAWYQGQAPGWLPPNRQGDEFGVLADAGVGLRLESTRTRGDQILHLDVAFPMREGPGVRGVEVTLTARQTL